MKVLWKFEIEVTDIFWFQMIKNIESIFMNKNVKIYVKLEFRKPFAIILQSPRQHLYISMNYTGVLQGMSQNSFHFVNVDILAS